MTEVRYESFTFSDQDRTLVSGASASSYFSPLGGELRAWQCKIPIIYIPRVWQVAADDFAANWAKGQEIQIVKDGAVTALFYLTGISGGAKLHNGEYLFELEGTSLCGLYTDLTHTGDVYNNSTVGDILYNMIGATRLPVLVDPNVKCHVFWANGTGRVVAISDDVYNYRIDGWLPYEEDARNNIKYLLQIAGAHESIITLSSLFFNSVAPLITNESVGVATPIDSHDIYVGDSYIPEDTPGEVHVNEYAYLDVETTPLETLYEATTADRAFIRFEGPMAYLEADGLTIETGRTNFAIVSGIGTLYGRPYAKTTRRLSQTLTTGTGSKTIDNPLASALNSASLLARMANYYETARIVRSAYKSPDDGGAGSLLSFEDPLGNMRRGYTRSCTLTFSGITKADADIVAGWSPIDGPLFSEEQIFTENGILTVPEGVTRLRLILIQGGKGGWGGYPGEQKADVEASNGGSPGEGGTGGKVYQIDLDGDDMAASYQISVGSPGAAGAANHGEGTEGGHSTATAGGTTYSSASGVVPSSGVADPMTGEAYAVPGRAGVYAGVKGHGRGEGYLTLTDNQTAVTDVTTWSQGHYRSGGSSYIDSYGGGPAYGSGGGDAESRGRAGNGANAVLDGFGGYTAPTPGIGGGGIGGNGGGGAGYGYVGSTWGLPGNGSVAGPGGQGAVIALMAYGDAPAPVPQPNYLLDSNGEQLYDFYYERLVAQEE